MSTLPVTQSATTLDPPDWQALREQGRRMLDDMFDYLEQIRSRPVWQPIPGEVRNLFREPLPQEPGELADVHELFLKAILPYAVGNAHPGFFGWVHGGGSPVGMLAEMLAAGLNANLGGRDQIPIEVERQIVRWVRELFGFPETASGLFVTGTSLANFIGLLVARTAVLGRDVRQRGIAQDGAKLVAYTSAGAHGCIAQAMDLAGLGTDALRRIPMNDAFQMDLAALQAAIEADRRAGLCPFFIAATAGSVDVGSIDDLNGVADLAEREQLWLHVDGAYAALGMLSPQIAPLLAGIERADSLAFDFHKWGQVPYDAGFILVRDGALHESTFASPANYLQRHPGGMAAGSPWPCDFGPDLSRGFRALKTWFTLKVYGAEKLGRMIAETCALAQYLKSQIEATPQLELLAPVALNIVCFRYRDRNPDHLNARIVTELQRSGIAAPSTTTIHGQLAIRVAIVNHRTVAADLDAMLQAVVELGRRYEPAQESFEMRVVHETRSLATSELRGLAVWARIAFAGGDLQPHLAELVDAIDRHPDDAPAMLDASIILQLLGQREAGLALQTRALELQMTFHVASAKPAKLRLLAFVTPGDLTENNALEFLLENSSISLDLAYLTANQSAASPPDHDVAMVAICESDRNRASLKKAARLLEHWPRPLINAPEQIAQLSRDGACELLATCPDLWLPQTVRVDRLVLEGFGEAAARSRATGEDARFPMVVRPIDTHKGQGQAKIDSPEALGEYLQARPDREFFVAPYVDYRSGDGLFRKYRVLLIDGVPLLCHLAISSHWMVHYMNAGMADDAGKRAEEATAMRTFEHTFAQRHSAAFRQIWQSLGLEYVGMDCAETLSGELLLFELDAGMTIHSMDSVELYPYKQPQMRKVFDAFEAMLLRRSFQGTKPQDRRYRKAA